MIVCIETFGRLVLSALDLRLLQLWGDRSNHARSHSILQIENVRNRSVKAFRPKMRTARGINELGGNAHLLSGLADAAFQHVADTEFAADLFYVDRAALVGERGIAG